MRAPIVNPQFILLLLPVVLVALTGLFPAQRYVRLFWLQSCSRPRFLSVVRADREFATGRRKHLAIVMLVQFLPLVGLCFIPSVAGFAIAGFSSVVAVAFVVFLLYYLMWRQEASANPLPVTARIVRLNIVLALLMAIGQIILCAAVVLLVLAAGYFMFFMLDIPFYRFPYQVWPFALAFAAYLNLVFIPRYMSLAALLLQPIETFIEKKKNTDASGHRMI